MVLDFNPYSQSETIPWVACQHKRRRVVFSRYNSGAPKFREYCDDCQNFTEDGYSGCGLKKAIIRYGHDPVMAAQSQKECTIRPRRADYASYMRSAEWFHKRQQIIVRSEGICEVIGCSNAAQEVHHMTYRNLGNEPLEDLRAVCRECHRKIHRRQE